MNSLDYFESFEWQGVFWFPQEAAANKDYHGKISYNPADGIKLSLFDVVDDPKEFRLTGQLSKAVMHGVVQCEGRSRLITLQKVHLSYGGGLSTFITQKVIGSVQQLILDKHCFDKDIKSIAVKYDKIWDSLFFYDIGSELYSYAKESHPIEIEMKASVKIDYDSTGRFLNDNSIEDVFFSFEENEYQEFKKEFQPIFDKYKGMLYGRKDISSEIIFSCEDSGVDKLINTEISWRLFWSFVSQDNMPILNSYCVHINEEGKREKFPLLSRVFINKKSKSTTPHLKLWKINRYSFGDKSGAWEQLAPVFEKWFQITRNKEWEPILYVIKSLVDARNNNRLVAPSDYLALVAAIETLMSLIGIEESGSEAILNKFFESYISDDWVNEFNNIATCKTIDTTYGEWFARIRNAITHPKSRNGRKMKKYYTIAYDEICLGQVYAFLVSLFVKAILSYIGNIDKQHIHDFSIQLLKHNASISYVQWED